jgi:hypothetical protein
MDRPMDAAPPLRIARPTPDEPDAPPPAAWVRAVQRAQQRTPCYRTEERFQCTVPDCEWRRACLKLVAAWQR